MLPYCLACPKRKKKKCDIPAGKAKQKQVVSFFLWANLLHTLNIKNADRQRLTVAKNISHRVLIFLFFGIFDRLWYVYKCTGWGRGLQKQR